MVIRCRNLIIPEIRCYFNVNAPFIKLFLLENLSIYASCAGGKVELFNFNKSIKFVWLNFKEKEIDIILDHLQILARDTTENIEEHILYSKILDDIKENKISLIQLSCLEKEIQDKNENYVQRSLKRYNT